MKFKNRITTLLVIMIFIMMLAGCQKSNKAVDTSVPAAVAPIPQVNLTVSAAASLTESMEEIKKLYASEKSNVNIVYNFGSSGSLQQQIEQGASVDIFFSAASKQMEALDQKSLIVKESKKDLLENKIVLITAKDVSGISDFKDVTSDKVKKIALGEPKSVPVGQYSEEVFTKLSLLDKVKPKAVYAKDVKEVLTWVESGNAEAGIVYATDAKTSDKVKVVAEAPAGSYTPALYPAAIIKDSKNTKAAEEFMKYLSGDKAKEVFKKYGFAIVIK